MLSGEAKGNLRIRSEGVVDLREKGSKKRIPALHLKATLANASGGEPWVFDPKEQTAIFPDKGNAPAMPLQPSGTGPVQVAPGESKQIDLYFKLPEESEATVDEFDVKWSLKAGAKEISELTTFARLRENDGHRMYPYYGMGVGSVWWDRPYRYYRAQPSIRVRN